MKVLLCLIPLLGLDLSEASGNEWLAPVPVNSYSDRNNYYYSNNHYYNRYYDEYGKDDKIEDEDKKDENIYRPCAISDSKCIRDFLIKKSICSSTYELPYDPYVIKRLAINTPHVNASAVLYNMKIKGLKTGRVEELFINKKTDTLILEVVFEEIISDSPKTRMIYYQRGNEPKEVVDSSVLTLKKLSLTLIIRHQSDPYHVDSHVYSFLNEPPQVIVGPKLEEPGENIDQRWIGDPVTTVKEALVRQGQVFLAAYLNNWYCNLKRDSPYAAHYKN